MNRENSQSLRNRASGLLQNMSCAPRAHIQHRSPYRRPHGRGIVFALRPGQDVLTRLLGRDRSCLPFAPPEDAERELRERIEARARSLPFPAAVLATSGAEPDDERCDDLLSIVTVLAKSSGHVYLRDKAPNLDQVRPGRRVVLLVPDERRAE